MPRPKTVHIYECESSDKYSGSHDYTKDGRISCSLIHFFESPYIYEYTATNVQPHFQATAETL